MSEKIIFEEEDLNDFVLCNNEVLKKEFLEKNSNLFYKFCVKEFIKEFGVEPKISVRYKKKR